MIYESPDVMPSTTVYEVESGLRIDRVMSVDTTEGVVVVTEHPLRVTSERTVATHRLRFAAVHPIRGAFDRPCLFHCYGRIAA